MSLEMVSDPETYTFSSQIQVERVGGNGAKAVSNVSVSVSCFPERCILIAARFDPPHLGARVRVQVTIINEAGTRYPATKWVEFHDNGTVHNYGNTSQGVRFKKKIYEIKKMRSIAVSICEA